MKSIWTMGEVLVEIMRDKVGVTHEEPGVYLGPYPSGAPGIFIDTTARLGVESYIVGGIGDDGFGRNLTKRFEKNGVNTRYLNFSQESPTATAFVTYDADGEREFIFHIKDTAATDVEIPKKLNYDNVGFYHIMGCSLTVDETFHKKIIELMKELQKNGAKVSFDPNIRPELLRESNLDDAISEVLKASSILLPGVDEIKLISKKDSVLEAVEHLFKNPVLDVIVLKKGSKGSTIYTRSDVFNIKSFKIDEVDPTGAGDCFDATFLASLLRGDSYEKAGINASAAGALNAQAFGPMEGDISWDSIERIINEQ